MIRRAERKSYKWVGIAAAVLLLAAVLVFGLRIKEVSVSGSNRYTPEQIENILFSGRWGNNTILAGRTVSTGTYGKTSGSTAVSSLIGSGLTGSGLTAGSLLGSFAGNTGLSGAGSLGTLLAAGKGENLSGEDWSNMVQILRLQMMMNMGKDTGTLI